MRWKITFSYLGTAYSGWQKQPGDMTVQEVLESSIATILRQPVEVTGCGRTDAGVHAKNCIAHFDAEAILDTGKTIYQLNAILPFDIAVHSIESVAPDFHARFNAKERMYRYYIHFEKNPFRQHLSFYFPQGREIDNDRIHQVSSLLLNYSQFQPFCKTGSDADHFACQLMESNWMITPEDATYTIRSNRFLRGMVRLVVGTCLNVALGKITLQQVVDSLETQTPVPQAWSVPPQGLFLEEVVYP